MTEPAPPPARPSFALQVPDALEGGVYSNLVAVWHTPYEFTLDFAVMLPTQMVTPPMGATRPRDPRPRGLPSEDPASDGVRADAGAEPERTPLHREHRPDPSPRTA